jgi:molecular chaperone GrpE (heat shock protein)
MTDSSSSGAQRGIRVGEPANGALGAPENEPDIELETIEEPELSARGTTQPASNAAPDLSNKSQDVWSDEDDTPTIDEATTSAASPDGPSLDEVTAALKNLETQVRGFHTRAESYEQIIRQMQSRIEQLQGDQVQALLKPLIQRFAELHAQATEASEQARDRGESAEKDFSFFAVAIEEALGLADIESVGAAPSVEFDSRKHHASRNVSTDDPELDKRVQRVLRQGFTYADATRVFLPAQVSVYRYEPPHAPEDEETSEHEPTNEPGEGEPGE